MSQNVFFEMEFILLIVFSVIVPISIYGFLYKRFAISRWTVVGFALLLIVVSGIDVTLLQLLSEQAKASESAIDDKLFLSQVSLALYLVPVTFAGLGVNLLSHVLVDHLNQAEKEFDNNNKYAGIQNTASGSRWSNRSNIAGNLPEHLVLTGSLIGIAVIFVLDLMTGAHIRLHVLYIFPLAMVSRYCQGRKTLIAALSLTTILQIITFSEQAIAIPSFITDICVAFAASVMTMALARMSRDSHLKVANLAATDPLTGLSNRREFMADVELEIERQKRYGGFFSLAILDLDGFKTLNDSKGHPSGDQALKLAADILRDSTRKSDSVGRLGGDEFAVLMLGTEEVDCELIFHELCTTIEKRMAMAGFEITASIGSKTFKLPPESTAHAFQQADEIMYHAKRSGKNRALHW